MANIGLYISFGDHYCYRLVCVCADDGTGFELKFSIGWIWSGLLWLLCRTLIGSVSSVRSQDFVWFLQANEGPLWWQSHLIKPRLFLLWIITVLFLGLKHPTHACEMCLASDTDPVYQHCWAEMRLCFGLVCLHARNTKDQQRGSQKHAVVWWRMGCVSNLSWFDGERAASQIWAGLLSPYKQPENGWLQRF